MYTSTKSLDEVDDTDEEDEESSDLEYLVSLEESLMIRAMTGGSSQKLTTVKFDMLLLLR